MVSICIPVYEMKGRGVEMLKALLDSCAKQSVPPMIKTQTGEWSMNWEVVISDNSNDYVIHDWFHKTHYSVCQEVQYHRNPGPHDNPASNFNNAINHAKGDIIKPMCQDDYFIDSDTLAKLANINSWAVCKSSDHTPYHSNDLKALREGENVYGSPSAVAWRRNELRFDENLLWLTDCEMWSRLQRRYGTPELIDTTVGIRAWEGQLTWELSGRRVSDLEYVQNKYK